MTASLALVLFCYALLCIPALNLLVGVLIGWMLAMRLLRERRFGRLLLGLPLAALWTISAFVLLAAFASSPSVRLGLLPDWTWAVVWMVVHLGLTHGVFVYATAGGRAGYSKQLALANAVGRGHFTIGCGCQGLLPQLYVDPDAKTLAFIAEKWFRIEPASFVSATDISYVAMSDGSTREVLLQLKTTDFNTPLIAIEMTSLTQAKAWQQRLQLLCES